MATNPRTQPTTDTDTPAEPAKAAEPDAPFVGPALAPGQTAQEVTLAHHLGIDGKDYPPGSCLSVSPDYARQLRGNGYAARKTRR